MDIGIIGGADGPTKIFISANRNSFLILIIGILILGLGIIIWSKKR